MYKIVLLPFLALFLITANASAQAAPTFQTRTPIPVVNSGNAGLIFVREGCGRGFHRNRWGHCRMNRRLRRRIRRHYRHHHRRCYLRWTPFGYQRVCYR